MLVSLVQFLLTFGQAFCLIYSALIFSAIAKGFGKSSNLLRESDLVIVQKVCLLHLKMWNLANNELGHLRGRHLLPNYHVVLKMFCCLDIHPLDASEKTQDGSQRYSHCNNCLANFVNFLDRSAL